MERIETTILRNLVYNEEYARKTIPFIQSDFFEERSEKILFDEIVSFITKYDACATPVSYTYLTLPTMRTV